MKKLIFFILFIGFFISSSNLNAQDIEIRAPQRFLYEPADSLELVIDFVIENISVQEQTVFEVRTVNDVPSGWTSSLCFGLVCAGPGVDSLATLPPFANPLQPGDTVATSIHVITDQSSQATAHIQMEVGTFHNPMVRDTLDFYFTTDPAVSVENEGSPDNYFLDQNYPNPFNPTTNINFGLKKPGFVTLKVYNVLGMEVATLVNEYKPAGDYKIDFDASTLASGVYLYRLTSNNFVQTRKMILEK